MVGDHQNLNGSRDLTTPLSRMVCYPLASTYYSQPTYQIWSPYLYSLQSYKNRYWDIARYWSKIAILTYPTSIWRPRWGDPVEISLRSLASETQVLRPWRCLRRDPMFSRFNTMLACDGQTDGHDDSKYRASIASRGKKHWKSFCDTSTQPVRSNALQEPVGHSHSELQTPQPQLKTVKVNCKFYNPSVAYSCRFLLIHKM